MRDSAATAAPKNRVATLVIPLLLALLAASSLAPAQEMPAPVKVQWAVLAKILSFDRNLTRSGEDVVVGVVFQPAVRASVLAKDELMAAINRPGANAGMRFSGVALRLTRADDLGRAMEASGADVLYITPMRAVDLGTITKQTRAGSRVTLTGVPEYVDAGVAVGVDLQGERPRILINLAAARAEGADFDSRLLKLAKIIE